MGKGTNYEKKPTILDGIVLAGKLLKHTRDIIKNEKVFDPKRDFQNRLLIRIYDAALDVNSKAYVANELRVGENDRVLYPRSVRSFIPANFACQKDKGTDAAREYWRNALHAAYLRHGTADFLVVCGDFKGYYDNMRHDVTNAMFRERLDDWSAYWVTRTLDRQYKGDRGYNPGSQMVQIAGISYLDRFDHFMKERMRIRAYVRYMDDFRAICRTEEEGRAILAAAQEEAAKVGLSLHPRKSRIVRAKDGALFLGFVYRVTDTGRVLMLRDPQRVKETRRKYRRLVNRMKRGEVAPEKLDASYQGVRACMEKGTNRRLIRRMDDFVNELKGELENAA